MSRLFEPIQIRHLTVKNRIAVPAMVRYWAKDDGKVTDMHLWHYESLARGGHGLIVQEGTAVNAAARGLPAQLGIWEDGQIEGMRRLVDTVHNAGSKFFIQIAHMGILAADPVGPSVYTYSRRDVTKTSRELSVEEIHKIQDEFASAAVRAVEAGYDGIELHGANGYLFSAFLNKTINLRSDAYGENRALFAIETLSKIRAAIGNDMIVGIRLGGFEPAVADGVEHARVLEDAGVDFISVTYGSDRTMPDPMPENCPFSAPVYSAKFIKEQVNVPVFGVLRITSPQMAEEILDQYNLDMVNIGRGVLVNGNWANDAQAGLDTGACLDCPLCQWRVDYTKCPGHLLFEKNREASAQRK